MNAEEYMNEMKQIAEEQGYELTPTAEKVARFMERQHIPLGVCPCAKDVPAPYRGCVGIICQKEIEEKYVCHCGVFKKGVKK